MPPNNPTAYLGPSDPNQRAVDRYLAMQQQAPVNLASPAEIQQLLALTEQQEQAVARAPLEAATAEVPNTTLAPPPGTTPNPRGSLPALPQRPYREPAMTDVPAQAQGEDVEQLAIPGGVGSGQLPAHETTPVQVRIDPNTGEFVAEAEGVGELYRVPVNASEAQIGADLEAYGNPDSFSGIDRRRHFSAQRALQIGQEINRLRLGMQSRGGPGGPLTTTTTSVARETGGPVDEVAAQNLADATGRVNQAQQASDLAEQGLVNTRAQAFGRVAQAQEAQARQLEEQAAQEQALLSPRMQAFDAAMANVASRRIDPGQVFGGFAGRVGAAIAVALGALGEGLGGGPNRALEIINNAVERNIRAQESELQGAATNAQLQGQALAQMRSVMGDARAGREAARALHYQALLSELDGLMTTSQGQHLAGLQVLRMRIGEQMVAAQEVARQRGQMRIREEATTVNRQRGARTDAGDRAVATAGALQQSNRGSSLGSALQEVDTLAQQDPQAATQRMEQLSRTLRGDQASQQALEDAWQGLYERYGIVGGVEGLEPLERSETAQRSVDRARERVARNPNDRTARSIVDSARRRRAGHAQRVDRSLRRFSAPVVDEEASREMVDRLRERTQGEHAAVAPTLPRGVAWDAENPAPYQAFQQAMRDPDRRTEFYKTLTELGVLDGLYRSIVRARIELGGEATDANRTMSHARAAASQIRNFLLRRESGAGTSEAEIERLLEDMPDPSEITAANAFSMWDRILNAWESFRSARGATHRARLRPFGLTTDNVAGNSPRAARIRAAAEASAQERTRASDESVESTRRAVEDRPADRDLIAPHHGTYPSR